MLKSLAKGKEAELELVEHLNSIGFDAKLNEDFSLRYEYDVICTKYNVTFEVKNDVMSARTGNLAIEYWNSKKNEPSGLYRTRADFWVHRFDDALWVCSVSGLLNFTKNVKPGRIINGGGDDNADLMLYRKEILANEMVKIESITSFDELMVLIRGSRSSGSDT